TAFYLRLQTEQLLELKPIKILLFYLLCPLPHDLGKDALMSLKRYLLFRLFLGYPYKGYNLDAQDTSRFRTRYERFVLVKHLKTRNLNIFVNIPNHLRLLTRR